MTFSSTITLQSTIINAPITMARDAYQLAVAEGFIGTRQQWLISLKGEDGVAGEKGDRGDDGLDGQDGRSVELQNNGTHIRWRLLGDISWNNLVSISELIGPSGTNGLNGAKGIDGQDGREVVLRVADGYFQWTYYGLNTWSNLLALDDLLAMLEGTYALVGHSHEDYQIYSPKLQSLADLGFTPDHVIITAEGDTFSIVSREGIDTRTTFPPIIGTGSAEAAAGNHLHVLSAHKPSSTSRASTTVKTNDPHLLLAVEANGVYAVEATLLVPANASNIQLAAAVAVPSGTISGRSLAGRDGGVAGVSIIDAGASANLVNTRNGSIHFTGTVFIGASAGNLSIQWAQESSSGTSVVLLKGSNLTARKLN
jgi:hypothetical protein